MYETLLVVQDDTFWFLVFVYCQHCAKEKEQSALRAHSSSVRGIKREAKVPEESALSSAKFQPFIKEEVLIVIYNDVFPCTAEQFFDLLLNDGSTFTNEYRSARKDTNLVVSTKILWLLHLNIFFF
ncbi:unnamed protein product [Ilex paraguariensis]|uniref:Uncharacterized protein n=1 Tax=Ilex paraguariensis TaxID=185542 RepID=A0ABC8UCF7_9AQUA